MGVLGDGSAATESAVYSRAALVRFNDVIAHPKLGYHLGRSYDFRQGKEDEKLRPTSCAPGVGHCKRTFRIKSLALPTYL
jgi:hypothetical protein